MPFEILQTVSLNGSSQASNEDMFGMRSSRAWIVDGATDLSEPGLINSQTGASWISAVINEGLMICPRDGVHATCRWLFDYIEKRFARDRDRDTYDKWELPSAAFTLVEVRNNIIEIAWSADCSALLFSENSFSWLTPRPDSLTETRAAKNLGKGVGALRERPTRVISDRRANRQASDYRSLTPNPITSHQSTSYKTTTFSPDCNMLLLMTDGFSSAIDKYQIYGERELINTLTRGSVAKVVMDIREIEADDAACVKYPRFKVSDDASAMLLKIRS